MKSTAYNCNTHTLDSRSALVFSIKYIFNVTWSQKSQFYLRRWMYIITLTLMKCNWFDYETPYWNHFVKMIDFFPPNVWCRYMSLFIERQGNWCERKYCKPKRNRINKRTEYSWWETKAATTFVYMLTRLFLLKSKNFDCVVQWLVR